MPEDFEGGQIYSAWWRVLISVAPELEAELVFQFPLACEAGISGLQSGECLSN